jgi:hypothetical protein
LRSDIAVLDLDLWCAWADIHHSDTGDVPETIRQRENKANDNQAAQRNTP